MADECGQIALVDTNLWMHVHQENTNFFFWKEFSSQASALIHIYTQRNEKDGRGSKELARRSIAYFESPRISNYLSLKCDQIVGQIGLTQQDESDAHFETIKYISNI